MHTQIIKDASAGYQRCIFRVSEMHRESRVQVSFDPFEKRPEGGHIPGLRVLFRITKREISLVKTNINKKKYKI